MIDVKDKPQILQHLEKSLNVTVYDTMCVTTGLWYTQRCGSTRTAPSADPSAELLVAPTRALGPPYGAELQASSSACDGPRVELQAVQVSSLCQGKP